MLQTKANEYQLNSCITSSKPYQIKQNKNSVYGSLQANTIIEARREITKANTETDPSNRSESMVSETKRTVMKNVALFDSLRVRFGQAVEIRMLFKVGASRRVFIKPWGPVPSHSPVGMPGTPRHGVRGDVAPLLPTSAGSRRQWQPPPASPAAYVEASHPRLPQPPSIRRGVGRASACV